MREIFVTQLVKDVLGPRNGSNGLREILYRNPSDEFITGVLEPIKREEQIDPDNEAKLPATKVEGAKSYQGDVDDDDVELSPFLSPSLDPKKRASTMGISFFVKTGDSIDLHVCVTWARYIHPEEHPNDWQRNPRYAIISAKINTTSKKFDRTINYLGEQEKNPEIKIIFLVKKEKEDLYFVSVFLVNLLKKPEETRGVTEFSIFQPQIRINSINETKIVSSFKKNAKTPEEEKMDFLYRNQLILARGHLVSAVWKEIDPEFNSEKTDLDYPQSINDPPFKWIDGEQLSDSDRKKFAPPEIRTDFVPLYLIPLPKMVWSKTTDGEENIPELLAENLSKLWETKKLKAALWPLYDGYKNWIDQLEKSVEEKDKEVSKKILGDCRTVQERIRTGINLISDPNDPNFDQDATLAFCFANKAIALQAEWKGNPFKYRPFQLGFFLMCLESVVNKHSKYRDVCDLMWVPTGTGKTEAYLALAAFTFAYRRRLALKSTTERTGAGISVLTRYTLRLLTIQQFRRTLSLITAAEYLRVLNSENNTMGWRPENYPLKNHLIWGSTPFSVGLWIGSGVTPNKFEGSRNKKGAKELLINPESGDGDEPAQVLECPVCRKDGILAISSKGLEAEIPHTIHFTVRCDKGKEIKNFFQTMQDQHFASILVEKADCTELNSPQFHTISLRISSRSVISHHNVSEMWDRVVDQLDQKGVHVEGLFTNASRPGYFFNQYIKDDGEPREYNFEIFCPNPECKLRIPWCGGAPFGKIHNIKPRDFDGQDSENGITLPDGNIFVHIIDPFQNGSRYFSDRVPIPGFTIDDQIYQRAPTVLIATSDKFARPPFEPNSATIFGNVQFHHCIYGYYRLLDPNGKHPSPAGRANQPNNWLQIQPLQLPDFILQDELHLIDGPLGSMVGIYEAALDFLSTSDNPVKYIASTATIRRADDHVRSLFNRRLQIFPPHGLTIDDRFFIRTEKISLFDDNHAGRLYLGICAAGRGPLTPLIRIWSCLAQTAWDHRMDQIPDLENKMDPFWTLTGYFNAVRELAGATALYRQDIKDRMRSLSDTPRPLQDDNSYELSGRTPATDLPAILDILEKKFKITNNDSPDSMFTTSMFGTGVDISRLGLMFVNGQPKTTSSYIQSTGRVGRSRGALVVTFFRASRPRDLNHYEFFSRHHMQIQRFVEAPTVYPFSSSLMDRALGPIGVYILRNMRNPVTPWGIKTTPPLMANLQGGYGNPEVDNLKTMMQERERNQPKTRKSQDPKRVEAAMASAIDTWQAYANSSSGPNLIYSEYKEPTDQLNPVVLGDAVHQNDEDVTVVYPNAPQSLRDLEEETTFQT